MESLPQRASEHRRSATPFHGWPNKKDYIIYITNNTIITNGADTEGGDTPVLLHGTRRGAPLRRAGRGGALRCVQEHPLEQPLHELHALLQRPLSQLLEVAA